MKRPSRQLVRSLYRTQRDEPFNLTDSQCDIFEAVTGLLYPRLHVMTATQFGKSDTISMAGLTIATHFPEKVTIIGPTEKKAKIIIGYAIQHIFDNDWTLSRFQIGKDESLERIKRERSKSRLTFKLDTGLMGEILVLSAEAHRQREFEKALMGFGGRIVLEDESCLIPDPAHGAVMRMLGAQKENYLVKIGNPFYRNHFLRSFRDPKYHKITVDWRRAVEEGRFNLEYIEEMRKELTSQMFGILYDCIFPEETAIDTKGYSPLLTDSELDRSYLSDVQLFGEPMLGCDPAGEGKNKSTIVLRASNGAKILYHEDNPDTMSFVGIIIKLATENAVLPQNVFVDIGGLGKGVFDRLNEQEDWERVTGVNFGERAEDDDNFFNLKAEIYWHMAEWLKHGAKLKRDERWEELLVTRYKIQSDRKVKLKPKEEMAREGIASPDIADSLAITFAINKKKQKVTQFRPKLPY